MKSKSNEFTDQILWSYLDGEADAALVAQIEGDSEALARADELIRARQKRIQPLRAPDTISSIELGAYHLGVLPASPKRARAIEQELKQHPGRVAELGVLDSYLAEMADELPLAAVPESTPTWWERVGAGIRVVMGNLVAPGERQPAFGLLGDEYGQKIYEAGEVEVLIQVEEDEEVPNRKALLGLVMGIEPEGLVAHLWQANPPGEVAVVEVDEFGNFIMPSLKPATYELILSNGETEIHIQGIEV